ncbi:hypothetical protein [Fodinibius halophilus]|uniref:Uncharacterized protein n=1 Tax=Fodinibius halophilus TaxID=1736908 RepID=A0A6M1TGV7_9BACT|nr:hypothetical protein [Fodinibius halophilus]NGP90004.1 hypothetical protein [Fodinibius halophilus]
MRLDKLIEQRKRQQEKTEPQKVFIYDPETPGEPEPPENTADVVIMLPDNGRD